MNDWVWQWDFKKDEINDWVWPQNFKKDEISGRYTVCMMHLWPSCSLLERNSRHINVFQLV